MAGGVLVCEKKIDMWWQQLAGPILYGHRFKVTNSPLCNSKMIPAATSTDRNGLSIPSLKDYAAIYPNCVTQGMAHLQFALSACVLTCI